MPNVITVYMIGLFMSHDCTLFYCGDGDWTEDHNSPDVLHFPTVDHAEEFIDRETVPDVGRLRGIGGVGIHTHIIVMGD